ncbi:protein RRP5 homolog [Venturia canescens]|uniref:protein RRP5 homolog n=1 Tax=Venturia canescens TaxID=32260 RepID=UPI001C9CD017|nr:protein RRP5 homolog [Venturia canescens]XP_043282754.1 protein RRP5 homolog [Venturia canescens]XP_043282762.1 protein RRP5 homolog [Venturia canescens]
MTLKSFPRGGKKPVAKAKIGLSFSKKDAVSKPKKNRGKKSRETEPVEEVKSYVANTAECLTFSNVGEGMIVLGRIQETSEYGMIVSLPGHLNGRIQATDVNESYTNLLRDIVNSEDKDIEEFKPLSELYNRGKYVVCSVKSIDPTEKWRISLSLEPELINRNLDPTKLCKGSKIIGTVSSIEDHGYVIDTGIDNFRAFLAIKDIDEGVKYYPGKQLFCSVKKVKTSENSTTAHLTTKSKHVGTAITKDEQSLDAQIPGSKLVLSVKKILSNGLQVSFNDGSVGYVNRLYLDKPLDSYEPGMVIHGVLMYVMPTLKFAYFTLLPSDENKEHLEVGDIVEKAKVSFIGPKGIVVVLKKGLRGFIPFRRTDVPYEKVSSKFSVDTTHKCRVLAYDLFEQIYVCTMERKLLEEKHFATTSFKPGDRVSVEVTKIRAETGFIVVTAGRAQGSVQPEHVTDPDNAAKKQLKVGDVVEARVLGPDKKQTGVLFTLKKSLIESTLPILHDFTDAQVGAKHHGTIVQMNSKGLLVRFYGPVKGWIPASSLDRNTASVNWNYMLGQTIEVTIEKVDSKAERLTLSVYKENGKPTKGANFEIGESVEGIVVEASVEGVHVRITKNSEDSVKTGFLPAGHMSPCEEVGSYLAARYTVGETISALVFSIKPRFLLTRTFVPRENYRDFETLKPGDCLPCSIQEINADSLKLVMPIKNFNSYGTVMRSRVENIDALHTHQILFAKVASIDRKHHKLSLITSLHNVIKDNSQHENDLIAAVDVLTLHFSKLRELSENEYYKNKPIVRAKIGMRVKATVDKVTDYGLVVKLENDVLGTVRKDHYKGKMKPGDLVNGTILWINYVHELAEITLLPNITNAISTKQKKLPKISIETQLRGDIVLVTNWFALVVLKGAGKGILAALPTRRHINDVEPDLTPYSIGKRIRCYVVLNQTETDFLPICLVKSSFEPEKNVESPSKKDPKRKSEEDEGVVEKKRKKMKREMVEQAEEKSSKNKAKVVRETKNDEVKPGVSAIPKDEKFSKKRKLDEESATLESKAKVAKVPGVEKVKKPKSKRNAVEETPSNTTNEDKSEEEALYSDSDENDEAQGTPGIPECGFFWDNKPNESLEVAKDESSSEDEDDEEETANEKKKKKKMTAAERREAERQKERAIREREEALASNDAPKSVDQFDRLVLSSPDSSMVWLQYMAYHLQATEIEKARAVAKRAIKTINFRETTERLNVWQAWLNLESRFGTTDTLESVFQEALRSNDARAVYHHMLTVHADAGRRAELEKIVLTMLKKFKEIPKTWVECGAAFLKIGLKEKSRHIMQRALQSLPAQYHVNLMVKFAHLENQCGDKERSQTLFEQILSSYPKRVDVWCSYVDTLIKSENFDGARKVLDNAVVQVLPARKMRTLFKKFIDFEQKHGTPEGVSRVQELALKYVQKECNTDV